MGTWELVDPPEGANVLGSKWVFDLKLNPDGTIERYKARLVCQGFGQKEGVDYEETFANTAGKTTIRLLLALICCLELKTKQLDVSTAFLYGDIDKEVYMKQPPGYDDGSGRVCRLLKSIYGLKQAPRIWEERLRASLLSLGFVESKLDPCLYILERGGEKLFLLNFVDDLLLSSKSNELCEWVKKGLEEEYKIRDMGEAQKYVGMWIVRKEETGEMWIHQAPYVLALAEKYNINCESVPSTPLPYDFVLEYPWEVEGEPAPPNHVDRGDTLLTRDEHKRYQQIVGALNYVAHSTRLDVGLAVNFLSRATHSARQRHLKAAEHVVRYLVGTAEWGLHFSKQSGVFLESFADANHAKDKTEKSISGLILQVGGGPVYWTARKQDRLTTSTTDSECLAVMTTVQYVEYLRDFLEELGCTQFTPTPLYQDNTATIDLCIDAKSHKRSIQLTRPMAFVRDLTKRGVIAPIHVPSKDQPADFLTKRLSVHSFDRCRELAGMTVIPE